MSDLHIWMRHEVRETERRAPITPPDAKRFVEAGHRLTVESSPRRVFADEEYAAAGCEIAPTGSWETEAPETAYVLGIKELPPRPDELRHRHIYFAHAFKGQDGAGHLLRRFTRGGGRVLDIEYLTAGGRRVVAFGYWAGYVGAALGVLALRDRMPELPLRPMERSEMDGLLAPGEGAGERALVIGASGRSGSGAKDALRIAGAEVVGWDRRETEVLDKRALLSHELLVNCVMSKTRQPAFVDHADLDADDRRLRVVSDVTCDVTSEANMVPINTAITTWADPVRRIGAESDGGGQVDPPLDVIAIDNLPSLLPREASLGFSEDLLPVLLELPEATGHGSDIAAASEPWRSAASCFDAAVASLD